jgi:hypothetical protein
MDVIIFVSSSRSETCTLKVNSKKGTGPNSLTPASTRLHKESFYIVRQTVFKLLNLFYFHSVF